MDLRQLEYFIAVFDERSFHRAALKLHLAQSTVSAAVQRLERNLGTQLVVRGTRHVQLTPAGTNLVEHGRSLLAGERSALDSLRAMEGVVGGRLQLGAPASAIPFDIPATLGRYHAQFPDVEIRLTTSTSGSEGLRRSVLDGRLDAAFVSARGAHPDLVSVEIAATPVELIVPHGHALADGQWVSISELENESFIEFPQGFGQRTVNDHTFSAADVPRNIAMEVTSASMAADFVRHGLGIAMVPRSSVRERDDVAHVPFTEPAPQWRIDFVYHSSRWRSSALAALLETLQP